jgi:hypothetical protein
MSTITRRDAVRAGVLSLAALAGCSSATGSESSDEDPRLDSVRVSNSLSRSVSLDLQLELDGEVVFWSDVGIEGTDADDDGQSVHGDTIEPPAFPGKRGEWRVRARVRDSDEVYETVFNSETTAESCLALGVTVQDDGVEITYVATHECSDATTTTTQS